MASKPRVPHASRRLLCIVTLLLMPGVSSMRAAEEISADEPAEDQAAADKSAADKPPAEKAPSAKPPAKRSPWMAMPIVASNPKLGTSLGALGGYLHKFDPKSRVSIFAASFQYTSTDSAIGMLVARTSFGEDHHRLTGIVGLGLIKNDYDDYLGTGQPLKTDDDLHAFASRYLYRFKGDWFVGGQTSIANYQVLGESDIDDAALEALGVRGFSSAGVGAVLQHDSRDSQDMPSRGWYMNLNNVAYREWLGGDDTFDVYRLDFRYFLTHNKRYVLAGRQNNQFTSDAPGAAQATVLLRGYKMGQYLAKNMASLEVEERIRFSDRWGANVFVGGAELYGEDSSGFGSGGFYPSYGAGVQFILKPAARMLASLEYAHGNADNYGTYLKLGYAW
jgi:hypothetical protein